MNRFLQIAFTVALSCGMYAVAQDPAPVQKESAAKPNAAVKQLGAKSDAEIAELVKEYTDEKTGKSYQLQVIFSAKLPARPLTEAQKKALLRSDAKLPYQVFAYLYEVNKSGAKMTYKRIDNGTFEFYIQNEAGKFVQAKKSLSFLKMCQS